MMIAIWGKDGTGKSTLAEAIGLFWHDASYNALRGAQSNHSANQKGLVLVIDTDTTQPTLTGRIPVEQHKQNGSIGRMLASPSVSDVIGTFHQHPKHEGLFFAGTTCADNYLSYESGMEQSAIASEYIQQCKSQVDTIIIDCSGQKDDPFVPVSLMQADKTLLLFSPTVQGVAWVLSILPLLERLGVMEKIQFVASQVHKHQDVRAAEKMLGRKVDVLLFTRSLHQLRCECGIPTDGRYHRLAISLMRGKTMKGGGA